MMRTQLIELTQISLSSMTTINTVQERMQSIKYKLISQVLITNNLIIRFNTETKVEYFYPTSL